MQQDIKAIIDSADRPRRNITPAAPIEKIRTPLPQSARWHMRHRPYEVENRNKQLK